ncbi:MAG: hypothetical protein HC796_09650 [Synechococcaceae cyanobacterium RL_1_2]|nr:hypothetical protein [Synechococcaceae cyanobacterium RL_1_2]
MNQNFYQMRSPNPNSGLGCLVFLILVGLIFGPAGLGWVVNGILLLVAAIVIIPLIAVFGLQWYFRKNQIAGNCPMCGYGFVAMKNTNVTCGQCGENLSIGNDYSIAIPPKGRSRSMR